MAPRPGTFLPFGSGVHACPGNDLAKLEMAVLVHRLVTNYRYVSPAAALTPAPGGDPAGRARIRHVRALGARRAVPSQTPRLARLPNRPCAASLSTHFPRTPRHFFFFFWFSHLCHAWRDCLGRWQVIGSSDDVTYSPFPVPQGGLRARLLRATTGGGGAEEGGRRAPAGPPLPSGGSVGGLLPGGAAGSSDQAAAAASRVVAAAS